MPCPSCPKAMQLNHTDELILTSASGGPPVGSSRNVSGTRTVQTLQTGKSPFFTFSALLKNCQHSLTQKMKLNVKRTYLRNSRPQQPSSRPLTLTPPPMVELAFCCCWRCLRLWKESPGFGGVMVAAGRCGSAPDSIQRSDGLEAGHKTCLFNKHWMHT